jgi:hypothetical protein
MTRTITVTDDDSDMVTTVVMERAADGTSLVQEIRFTSANGSGLGTPDLSVLREFGLAEAHAALPPAPEPQPEPNPAPAVQPPPAPAKAGAKGRAKKQGKPAKGTGRGADRLGRQYRRAPDAAELQQLHADHGGPNGVARHLGVPVHSVAGWLRRYRSQGHEFV